MNYCENCEEIFHQLTEDLGAFCAINQAYIDSLKVDGEDEFSERSMALMKERYEASSMIFQHIADIAALARDHHFDKNGSDTVLPPGSKLLS